MATAADMVTVCKSRYLVGGANEQRNQLSADYTAGQTTLAFKYDLKGIQAGSTLTIGLNVFYVWSADASTKTASVIGGQQGSVNTSHATGDMVSVSPRYTDYAIFTALNEELASLDDAGFFQVAQVEFAYSQSKIGYNLPPGANINSIMEVRYEDSQPFARTPRIPSSAWRLERNYLTSENASTTSLKLLQGGYPGKNITVLYRTGFTQFASLTDNVTVTGLPASAYDIPPMGAALRLGVGREIRRNDVASQGDTRRAEEVPAGAAAGSWRQLAKLYQDRISAETQNLMVRYPLVMP